MQKLTKGANAPLNSRAIDVAITAPKADVSAYLLGADGKVRGDQDMIFYNQPAGSGGAVQLRDRTFSINLDLVEANIDRIAFCATPETGTIADMGAIGLEIPGQAILGESTAGMSEAAIIVGELYRRGNEWKVRSVMQGFNGGLAPLARHFGINVDDDAGSSAPAAGAPAAGSASKVDLRKQRLVSLEKTDPQLVSLAKAAGVSLEKKSLANTTAKVVLVLDISASMSSLYSSGAIQRLTERVLGMGLQLDDDGSIEVYAFGSGAYRVGEANHNNYRNFVDEMLKTHRLEGSTHYGKVVQMIRGDYSGQANFGQVPVYVMFVTDGDTQDRALTEREIRDASSQGIFWQFMGIKASRWSGGFTFLEKLDDLSGRIIDNCDFFSVQSPDELSDTQLYDKMMDEYPGWLTKARQKNVLR